MEEILILKSYVNRNIYDNKKVNISWCKWLKPAVLAT
jgi:hypothetical protein